MTNILAVTSNNICYNNENLIKGYLIIENGKIKSINTSQIPSSFSGQKINIDDNYIFPGFIDLHIHGAGGFQVKDDPEDIRNLSKYLIKKGVTSFYPTLSTFELSQMKKAIASIVKAKNKNSTKKTKSSEILGIHLEGPFLSEKEKGVMPPDFLLNPSIEIMKEIENIGGGLIKRITLAPEMHNSIELIKYLVKKGYVVAGGHTDSSYAELIKGIQAGISVANHMYNAMKGFHHREPGAVGAFLTDSNVVCEIIGDCFHVHPAAIDIAKKCKGIDNIYLISDAIIAAGLSQGTYSFPGQTIYIDEEGRSRLSDGTIAGSTALMLDGFKNLITKVGFSLFEAVKMTSENPAKVADEIDKKGSINEGKDADLIIMNKNYEIQLTIKQGEIIYNKKEEKR